MKPKFLALLALTIVGTAVITLGLTGHAHAQKQPPPKAPRAGRGLSDAFHYVGLSTTIARIHRSTGQVSVLINNKDQRNALQGRPQAAGWEWVRVNNDPRAGTQQAP